MAQKGHPKRSLLDSFEDKCIKSEGCWEWIAKINERTGYGQIGYLGKHYLAHRVSYMLYKGALRDDLVIDHLCKNRWCVNPNHLEQVTSRENNLRSDNPAGLNARKNFCLRGHPLSGDNVYIRKDRVGRYCKECNRIRSNKYLLKAKV